MKVYHSQLRRDLAVLEYLLAGVEIDQSSGILLLVDVGLGHHHLSTAQI